MFDQLADLESRIAALVPACDSALDRCDGTRLGDVVLRLDTAVRQLEALRLRVSAAHATTRAWHDDGARNAADWHRAQRHLTRGQAARELQTADGLQDLPKLAEQVAAGEVSVDHAAVVAQAARDVPAERLGELDGLAAATASTATTRELRDTVTDFVHRVQPDVVADRERRAFEARHLQLGRRNDGAGVWIRGRLDVIGGEELLTAISALSAPRGDEDERTAGQRRADALADLAGRALRHDGELPADGGQRPQVGVVVPAAALAGDAEAPTAQLGHEGPVSAATARQLACDAGVHRVVTAGRNEILDVGRSRRVVTIAQRRALTVRDGGCVGCGAPPAWTDAHHIRHWADEVRPTSTTWSCCAAAVTHRSTTAGGRSCATTVGACARTRRRGTVIRPAPRSRAAGSDPWTTQSLRDQGAGRCVTFLSRCVTFLTCRRVPGPSRADSAVDSVTAAGGVSAAGADQERRASARCRSRASCSTQRAAPLGASMRRSAAAAAMVLRWTQLTATGRSPRCTSRGASSSPTRGTSARRG